MRRTEQNPDDERPMAMFIAMVVRNAMEDFHVAHLSDAQMAELNPIIRNAIFTALHALKAASTSLGARIYVKLQEQMIPDYWEQPVLLGDYVTTERVIVERMETVMPRHFGGEVRERGRKRKPRK